ncbi:NUDIX hydrolase [Magnetospirillum sulfuroxidans]|uniref:DUF4743 domain-containing protein n=1 Tax=Magnetospirillum sulfuroxidans TaxID=611300 RepID=A0ABS5IFS3_9PROT|nr:DUF4743 domain-containing protein [Magnetospirillum sulfuroxidans]MBR9972573.1 DUF4743 domain-containing protein [Magnetospirillum sulfuroxidans]
MAFLDHIALCNQHELDRFRPFLVEERHVGWVRADVAWHLEDYPRVFTVTADAVSLHPHLIGHDARSAAVDEVCRALHVKWQTPALRGERYRVAQRWSDTPLMTMDRGVVSLFGVRAFGVHVNGFVRDGDRLKLWVATRATDRAVAPGKLDNLIAGGQPAHLSLQDNLIKEAAEEAGMPEDLARTARPAGVISYCLEDSWGLKPDVMFCYDLELPADFTPRNTDGEVASFTLMDVDEVKTRIRDTQDFKYNVNLVVLDFLIRHGVLCPDSEPDYAEIAHGLKQGW